MFVPAFTVNLVGTTYSGGFSLYVLWVLVALAGKQKGVIRQSVFWESLAYEVSMIQMSFAAQIIVELDLGV